MSGRVGSQARRHRRSPIKARKYAWRSLAVLRALAPGPSLLLSNVRAVSLRCLPGAPRCCLADTTNQQQVVVSYNRWQIPALALMVWHLQVGGLDMALVDQAPSPRTPSTVLPCYAHLARWGGGGGLIWT